MPKKATVLSVDDDQALQITVAHYLEEDGYTVLSAFSGAEAVEKLKTESPDLVLLDLVLPDEEGFRVLTKIKAQWSVPVIIVSGKSDTTEKIVGLEMGADDYITKPFEMRELSARIKAVIRRGEPAQAPAAKTATSEAVKDKIMFGDGWVLDRLQYQLFDKKGASAELTAGEFRLLEALVMSPNRALTRDYLFELTRENEFDAFDRAIDIQIGRLRKKLNDDPKDPAFIKTVRGVGYMFCADVKA